MRTLARFSAVLVSCCFLAGASPMTAVDGGSGSQGKLLNVQDSTDWVRYGRWSALRQHTMHVFAQLKQDQYCAVYSTTIVDEAKDLDSSQGQDVALEPEGKDLVVTLHSGRRLKMRLVKTGECQRS